MAAADKVVLVPNAESSSLGAVVLWNLTEMQFSDLTIEWTEAGLPWDWLPEQPSDTQALRRALDAHASRRMLVRPLESRGSWALVSEHLVEDEQGTTLTHVTSAKVSWDSELQQVLVEGGTNELRAEIELQFSQAKLTLTSLDLSSWLVDITTRQLHGIPLKLRGGVYFVPKQSVELYARIARVLGRYGSSVTQIPAMTSAEALEAITEALQAEVEAVSEGVRQDLQKGLGERALKTRENHASELLERVKAYSDILGTANQALVRKVEELRIEVATLKIVSDS
jgi:hypothetical protein